MPREIILSPHAGFCFGVKRSVEMAYAAVSENADNLYMLGEIFKCNIAVLKLILSPDQEPEPQLHYFKTGLRTDPARVTLANSITITPGTITCTMEDDQLCVHALDRTLAEGLTQGESERRLKALEEVYDDAD